MKKQVGQYHGDLGQGIRLYRDVRQYTCKNECGRPYYDFSRAIPADAPVRIFRLIRAPRRPVNIVDPVLFIGLIASATLMVGAFLISMLNITMKIVAVTLIVTFTVWLMRYMGPENEKDGPDNGSAESAESMG